MNPYLKIKPRLLSEFSASSLENKEAENAVKQLVRQYNLLTYIDYSERLPNFLVLERDLKQKKIATATIPPLLWVLGQSFELLPVAISPEVERFEQIHFMINSDAVLDSFLRSIAQEAGSIYQKVSGTTADLTRIYSVSKNPAFFTDMTENHRKLYIQCRIIAALTDYREMLQREPQFMDPVKIQERRNGAVRLLERMSIKSGNESTAESEVQSARVPHQEAVMGEDDDLHFSVSGIRFLIPHNRHPHRQIQNLRSAL